MLYNSWKRAFATLSILIIGAMIFLASIHEKGTRKEAETTVLDKSDRPRDSSPERSDGKKHGQNGKEESAEKKIKN